MKAKLLDDWFEAQLIGFVAPDCKSYRHTMPDGKTPIPFELAQGVLLWCPCGYHDRTKYPINGARPHGLLVIFAGRGVPDDFGPFSRDKKSRPRWNVVGSSLENLTCTPSVAVGDPECWHGYITNGEVDPVQLSHPE